MAQTLAAIEDISGYAQNSLPIAPETMELPGMQAEVATWKSSGNAFIDEDAAGDIATWYYSYDLKYEYLTPPQAPLPSSYWSAGMGSLNTMTIPVWKLIANPMIAINAIQAHSINTVIAALEQQGAAGQGNAAEATVPISDINKVIAAIQQTQATLNPNGTVISVSDGMGGQLTLTAPPSGSSGTSYESGQLDYRLYVQLAVQWFTVVLSFCRQHVKPRGIGGQCSQRDGHLVLFFARIKFSWVVVWFVERSHWPVCRDCHQQ